MSEEIVKKPKAPAKPRATATKAAGTAAKADSPKAPAPKKVAAKKIVAAEVGPVAPVHQPKPTPSHHEIAQLAERFWAERGWQDGHAEQDWLRAEHELQAS
ncbi:MAG: hypothetical protein JWM43_1823 [Acidobacteriaceae bacterium]|nr:hypothetical protein [Acidobacteriaceae bacterium]